MGISSSTLITDPDSSATVPPATSTTMPDPDKRVPGGTTTTTPATSGNLDALVMAVNTKLPGLSPSLPEPDPSQRVTLPSINSNPLASVNSTATPLSVPDPSNVLPVETSPNTPAPVTNLAVPKLNVALLHQKLQEAKARQLNMVPAGNIADKELPPIAEIVGNKAKVTEQSQNDAVPEPTVSAYPQVLIKRESHSYFT